MDQRQARVFQRQYARAYGHLERRVQRFRYGVGQAEFFFYIQAAAAGGQLNGLVHGFYLLYAVVAGRRFYHAHDILIYLFRAPPCRDRFYHILPGEYFVKVMFAE